MADNVKVTYNGNTISPPPFVSRGGNPIDYGARWGYEDTISLKGSWYISGDTTGSINRLMGLFSGQFVPFKVENTVAGKEFTVIDYKNVILDDISFDSYKFSPNTYANYTAKLRNINVPSGIIEPSNEYSFTQNEEGTVTLSHKVSAKGVITQNSSAINNAVNFVRAFTGITPFGPAFASTGTPVLLSQAEAVDRLNGTYSVTESFKYNTGENLSYIYIHTLDLDESKDLDYRNLNFSLSLQGSSIKSNLGQLRLAASGINVFQFINDKYSISTGNLFLESMSVAEDSGKNFIQISSKFVSGIGDEFSGYLDYDLDFKWDKIADVRTFNINGKYVSKAPIDLKRIRLATLRTAWNQSYLYGLITGSYFNTDLTYNPYTRPLNPIPSSFTINENTGLADFSMSATFDDKDYLSNISDTTFSLNFDAQRNIYEFKPSANIEGVYVIQDLQALTRENIKYTSNFKTTGNVNEALSSGKAMEAQILGVVKKTGSYLIESGYNTGVFDVSLNSNYLNSGSKFTLPPKYYYSSNPPSIRDPGYKFGK